MPYTFGAGELTPDQIDVIVEHDEPLPALAPRPPTPAADAIAALVAAEVPPGACLQLGVGRLPDVVAAHLAKRGRYAIHSGMISDWSARLAAPGRVAVAAEAVGSAGWYRWLDRNPGVRFERAARTHLAGPGPGVPWFAINAGLQADLAGAVNAEAVGGRVLSGPGGLPDFALAAQRTEGGASIVMITATSGRQARSSIVARIEGPATVPAWLADRIVSEHGVAQLRGRPDRERAAAMLAVAPPECRAALAAARPAD
jgi:acyl-CoA hydrolase